MLLRLIVKQSATGVVLGPICGYDMHMRGTLRWYMSLGMRRMLSLSLSFSRPTSLRRCASVHSFGSGSITLAYFLHFSFPSLSTGARKV